MARTIWSETCGTPIASAALLVLVLVLVLDTAGCVREAGIARRDDDGGVMSTSDDAGPGVSMADAGAPQPGEWSAAVIGDSTTTHAVAVDDTGNVYVAGRFPLSAAFGGPPRTSHRTYEYFVASFTREGAYRWDAPLDAGASLIQAKVHLALSHDGSLVVVAGEYSDGARFPDGTTVSPRGDDAFVVALHAETGAGAWSRTFGGTGDDAATDVACDDEGHVAVVGTFQGRMDVGTASLSARGRTDVFVATLTTAGEPLQARAFGAGTDESAQAGNVAFTAGGFLVSGGVAGTLDVGSTHLTAEFGSVFVARLDRTLAPAWAHVVSNGGLLEPSRLVPAADGAFFLTGRFRSQIVLGTDPPVTRTALLSTSSYDAFAAAFAADGKLRWARGFGQTGAVPSGIDWAESAALSGDALVVAGAFNGMLVLDDTTTLRPSIGDGEDVMYLLALGAADGATRWALQGGSAYRDDIVHDLVVAPDGDFVIVGDATPGGTLDGLSLVADRGSSFIAKLRY